MAGGLGWSRSMGIFSLLCAGLLALSGCCGACGTGEGTAGDMSAGECPCSAGTSSGECDDCSVCAAATAQSEAAQSEAAASANEESNDEPKADSQGGRKVSGPLSFTMKGIDGKPVDLAKYKGKVVMIVNVASKCGLTPQYKQLEALYEKYADKGFAIIGVPANNFGNQEPGTNEEIAEFCAKNYGVKFDLLAKVSVKGEDKCELYQFLTSKETNPKFAGEITWNFEKFLIGRDGQVVARFAPRVKPDDPQVIAAIEAELDKKP